jgi:hypothetical protein
MTGWWLLALAIWLIAVWIHDSGPRPGGGALC